jgi:hypothetical protein
MPEWLNARSVDIGVVTIANLANLLMIGIFLSRVWDQQRLEHNLFGVLFLLLALPLIAALVFNVAAKREWWTVVLPALLLTFQIAELLLDYILKIDFRRTRLLGPYLGLYYLALMGMIGYSFGVGKPYGFVTLGTYFLNLLATWYSYSRVGHG